MKVSCHEIFVGCRDVELLKVLFLDFWRMVNHQTRLPFGEYVVLIFANYQTCKSTTIMSWIQHQVRIERRSSINLCKFGAMRYSPPTPKKNHSPISSSSAGGELLALFVWLPIVKFRQDFHQQYLHVVGMEKAENSSWQLDWVRLLHLNKSYGKKNLQPQKHQQRIPDSSPEVVGFCKKKLPGRCIALTAGQEMELQMCYSFAAREGGWAVLRFWGFWSRIFGHRHRSGGEILVTPCFFLKLARRWFLGFQSWLKIKTFPETFPAKAPEKISHPSQKKTN